MKASKFFSIFILFGAVLIMGCNKDSNPAGPGGGPTYYGTIANGSETGTLTLTFASAPSKVSSQTPKNVAAIITITGTLKIQGSAPITLTGTYDTETDSLKITAGPYTFQGTYSDGEVAGSYDGPNGVGSFTAGVSTSGSSKVYCGQYTENSPDTGTGKINVIVDGTKVTVLVRNNNAENNNFVVYHGVVEGTAIMIYLPETTTVFAHGQLTNNGNNISGSYAGLRGSGVWSAEVCQ